MASIVPGYEYDIFISYRQKDNKHDSWVTKFVENLKGELESTFKEDISIYFDENPHDRLQETHNVDKSLEGKLKCLIFIPILSQTYCDPNSYAWQYEFMTFLRMAENDRFGKDIKLRSGNVASRILPIRIHDLEPEDIKLFENETRNVLRALDFVFKTSTGVNRSLKPNEDHPNDNLNKTFYSDQINKVANAIKEIILGLKIEATTPVKEKNRQNEIFEEVHQVKVKINNEKSDKLSKRKLLSGVAILAILIVTAIFAYPKIFNIDKSKVARDPNGKISIAVNTFDNLTGDTTLNYMRIGLPNILRGYLANLNDLSVQSTTTMDEVYQSMQLTSNASLSPSLSREAAIKLKAGTYLTGSFQKIGNKTLVQFELNDTQRGIVLISDTAEGILPNLNDFKRISASLSQKLKNYLEIKAISNNTSIEFRDAFTNSADAYRKYIKGMNSFMNGDYTSAIELYKEAFKIDSTFTLAAFYIANANNIIASHSSDPLYSQQAIFWTQKAYEGKERLPEDYQLWVKMWRAWYITKNSNEVLNYCSLLEKSVIKSRYYWYDIGVTYYSSYEMVDKAISMFQKIETISSEWGEDWKFKEYYQYYGEACHNKGMHDKEAKIYEKGLKLFPDNWYLLYGQTRCAIAKGDTVRATELINKQLRLAKEQGISQRLVEYWLGSLYNDSKSLDKAEEHYRAALKLDPDNYSRLNSLAAFLIDNDRNINEGMNLINTAIEINPGNGFLLWTKGNGYYKQGRYKEALDLLQQAKDIWGSINPKLDNDIQKVRDSINRQQ
jgi:tetratricopeptide (TPR) repeat protein